MGLSCLNTTILIKLITETIFCFSLEIFISNFTILNALYSKLFGAQHPHQLSSTYHITYYILHIILIIMINMIKLNSPQHQSKPRPDTAHCLNSKLHLRDYNYHQSEEQKPIIKRRNIKIVFINQIIVVSLTS